MSGLYGAQPSAASGGGSVGTGSSGTGSVISDALKDSSWLSYIPVVGPVLSAIGSILGVSAQRSANKSNLALQRETNALNYQMFQEQQKFAWDMWKATNKYNTPAHQRELMQSAGFNPNMIFGFNQGGASNISSPTPNGAQVGHPMQPVFRSEQMEGLVNSSANAAVALSDARYKDAQAAGQRIDNLYNAKQKEADLLLKGDQHTAQAIQNEVDFSTKEDKKRAVSLQNTKTEADTKKALSEEALNKVLERFNDAKIDEVREAINLLIDQQDETKAREAMQRALGSKYLAEKALADVQRVLAPAIASSQIAANRGQAAQAFSQAEATKAITDYQNMVNDVYKVFGKGKAAQDFLNAIQNEDVQFWQAEEFRQSAEEKGIFNKYADFKYWMENAHSAMKFFRDMWSSTTPGQ